MRLVLFLAFPALDGTWPAMAGLGVPLRGLLPGAALAAAPKTAANERTDVSAWYLGS